MPITKSNIAWQVVIHTPVNIYGSKIGQRTKIGMFTEIGNAVVGEDCIISAQVFIPEGVEIQSDVFIGPGVRFCNVKHVDAYERTNPEDYERTTVQCGASIGANATILPGLTIGHNSIIGAGSVVTHDVPAGETWYGNPARPNTPEDCDCCYCMRHHFSDY